MEHLIKLQRTRMTNNCTFGKIIIGLHQWFTLEDVARPVKVMHETRIPSGLYRLELRTVGRFHDIYSRRFPDIHEGMLQLSNVPGYKYILIHCGNTKEDTSGCILIGKDADYAHDQVLRSTIAYKEFYPAVLKMMKDGPTYIEVRDEVKNAAA